MTIARHLSDGDLKLTPPGNLTEEQRAAWDAAYGPKNEAFRAAGLLQLTAGLTTSFLALMGHLLALLLISGLITQVLLLTEH